MRRPIGIFYRASSGVVLATMLRDYTVFSTASLLIVSPARTGNDMMLASGSTSARRLAASSTPVYEDRGSGSVGVWSFPGYRNEVLTGALDINSGWTSFLVTRTNCPDNSPDGTQNAARIADSTTSGISIQRFTPVQTLTGLVVCSLWYKELSSNAPTVQGNYSDSGFPRGSVSDALNPGGVVPVQQHIFERGGGWRRSNVWASDGGANTFDISIAGQQDASDTTNQSATGTMDLWGASVIDPAGPAGAADMPLVSGTTGPVYIKVPDADTAQLVMSGNMNVRVSAFSPYLRIRDVKSGWVLFTTGTDGYHGVYYTSGTLVNTWTGYARSTAIISGSMGWGFCNHWSGTFTGEAQCDWIYDVTRGRAELRVGTNGCTGLYVTGSTTGTALQVPSASYLGSSGSDFSLPAVWTTLNSYQSRSFAPEGLIVGDSIMAWENVVGFLGPLTDMVIAGGYLYGGLTPLYSSGSLGRNKAGIISLAHPGDTVANQKVLLQNWTAKHDMSSVKWVLVQIGVNDCQANSSEPTLAASFQDLQATITGSIPGAIIIWQRMTPASARMTFAQLQVWATGNLDIDGTGPNPISGITKRISLNSTNMDAGAGALRSDLSQDGIHVINLGKEYMMQPARNYLLSNGYLQN